MALFAFRGMRPKVGSGVYIADSAEVIGNVVVGNGVYIGPGAKIRGDYGAVIVGDGTAVEENCVMHARPNEICRTGVRVTLGHMCILHNVNLVDDYAVIGMGAIVSDWAVVGRWAVVAEGGLVKNRQEISAETIAAGVPARSVGTVTPEFKKKWEGFKQLYVDLARTYRSDLQRID